MLWYKVCYRYGLGVYFLRCLSIYCDLEIYVIYYPGVISYRVVVMMIHVYVLYLSPKSSFQTRHALTTPFLCAKVWIFVGHCQTGSCKQVSTKSRRNWVFTTTWLRQNAIKSWTSFCAALTYRSVCRRTTTHRQCRVKSFVMRLQKAATMTLSQSTVGYRGQANWNVIGSRHPRILPKPAPCRTTSDNMIKCCTHCMFWRSPYRRLLKCKFAYIVCSRN